MIEQNQNVTTVSRPGLLISYVEAMVTYLMKVEHIDRFEAERFVKGIIQSKYKPKQVTFVKTIGTGRTQVVKCDFWQFTKTLHNKVLTPSGSAYYPTAVKSSPVSEFLQYKKKQRSKVKKEQLKAIAANDNVEANRLWYLQASIKISMNSLPGAYGSEYSIFYDKGGYNSITSTGRWMVRSSSVTSEQFLGGMFAWWSEQELINWIIIHTRNMPKEELITYVMNKYQMKHVTQEQLYNYYKDFFTRYTRESDYFEVRELIYTLTPIQVDFLFYYCNLRNIMQYNEHTFKPLIQDLLNVTNYQPVPNATTDDLFKIPEDIRTVVTVAFTDALGGKSVDDITKTDKELIPLFVGIAKGLTAKLNSLDEIFEAFVNTWVDIPNKKIRGSLSKRNTVILQDTDSSMFTTKQWDNWYSGLKEKFSVDNTSLAINALCVYWLTNAVKFAMYRFSVKHGVTTPYMSTLSFKNEFLFTVMLLMTQKKTYCNLIKVKEGVVMTKPKPDIKGQALRGSAKSPEINQFIEDLLVNDIMIPASHGKLSAYALIEKVVNFEIRIKNSYEQGYTTFLNTDSLKFDKDYKNPDQPILQGFRFWEDLLAKKYGSISRPAKVISFTSIYPSQEYLANLETKFPKFHKKLVEWMALHAKWPSKLIINPSLDRVPPEIVGLIDVKHLININCKAIYDVMNRLNVNCGNPDMNILFSELYGNDERLALGRK